MASSHHYRIGVCLMLMVNILSLVTAQHHVIDEDFAKNMSQTAIWNSKTIREGLGWKIVYVNDAHVFLTDGVISHSPDAFRAHLTGHNTLLANCPTHEKQLTLSDYKGEDNEKFLMLKLATTGSTWIGDLLEAIDGCRFAPELITGSDSARMTDSNKLKTMKRNIEKCNNKVCGFSVNSKASANLRFPDFAHENKMRLVLWIRSNMVSYVVGLVRAGELRKGPCHTNNVRLDKAEKCELPKQIKIPIETFKKQLKKGSLYNAVNLGIGFSNLKCSNVDKLKDTVYELYYEAMLADKEMVLKQFMRWLGHPELLDKSVQRERQHTHTRLLPYTYFHFDYYYY
jgi:hypothetical protein